MKIRAWIGVLCTALAACAGKSGHPLPVIVFPRDAHPLEKLAAKEVRRYLYLRTGRLPAMKEAAENSGGKAVFIGAKSGRLFELAGADVALLEKIRGLGPEAHGLKSVPNGLFIAGGDPVGTLYGAYRFCELLDVGFDIDGDAIPDERLKTVRLDGIDEWNKPLFKLRGINPFHDFPEGPDWWEEDNYRSVLEQLAKLRMNFIGLHNYNYRSDYNRMEPSVWVGLKQWVGKDGSVRKSYPSKYANTGLFSWGYKPRKTSDFSCGAAALFDKDEYGPAVMDGLTPIPDTQEKMNDLFNRVGRFFDRSFGFARRLGIKTCVGTEATFEIHDMLRKELKKLRIDPEDSAGRAALYEGMFTRILRAYPIDYYWIWTDEGWTWSVPDPDAVSRAVRGIRTAHDVLGRMGTPFGLAISGWVLGPPNDRILFDKELPKDVVASAINRNLGYDPVDFNFYRVRDREKWAIPWLEDDPALMNAQLWAGRVRRDAADALAYGCSALIGLHWRTRTIAPTFASLARSAWEQPWNPDAGKPYTAPDRRIPDVQGTEHDSLYATVAYNPGNYDFPDPGPGGADITLHFCETELDGSGRRVFDVLINDSVAAENVDVFKAAGKNRPYDLVFKNRTGGKNFQGTPGLKISFASKKGFPMVSGIEFKAKAHVKKINCGGEAYREYEKDIINPFNPRHPYYGHRHEEYKPDHRAFSGDAPVLDFYREWCRARFGERTAGDAARLFASIDGDIPRASEWRNGPGDIRVDRTPWDTVSKRWAFVDDFRDLEPRVKGPGSLERFEYWCHVFEYARSLARFGCAVGGMDVLMEKARAMPDGPEKNSFVRQTVLPRRIEMTRMWEALHGNLLAFVSTTGELGMVANLEQDNWPVELLYKHDQELAALAGSDWLPDARPSREFRGDPRIIVPAAPTSVDAGREYGLKVILLGGTEPKAATLGWRPLGSPDAFREIPLSHAARGVYGAVIPAADIDGDFEFRIRWKEGTVERIWPASAPERNHTVVVCE